MQHLSLTLDVLNENKKLKLTRDQIDTLVDSRFSTNNERMLLKAFLYRKVLNYTPREVGRELKLSRIKVNLLIQTIPHYRLDSTEFNNKYVRIVNACADYAMYFQQKEFVLHVGKVRDRLSANISQSFEA